MQTKREYLISLGLAKPGRGKFSNAGKEALVKAIGEGMTFADTAPAKPTEPRKPKSTKPVEFDPGEYVEPSMFRFPEAEYHAVEVGGTRTFSVKEVCNNCGYSLTGHLCNDPMTLGVPVRIVAVSAKVA